MWVHVHMCSPYTHTHKYIHVNRGIWKEFEKEISLSLVPITVIRLGGMHGWRRYWSWWCWINQGAIHPSWLVMEPWWAWCITEMETLFTLGGISLFLTTYYPGYRLVEVRYECVCLVTITLCVYVGQITTVIPQMLSFFICETRSGAHLFGSAGWPASPRDLLSQPSMPSFCVWVVGIELVSS